MYDTTHGLYVAHGPEGPISILGKMANRHGLIAGATGTGKTVTLQVLAESFSQAGVPCFMADMKGDLSGISQPGRLSSFIEKRLPEFGMDTPQFSGCPTRFYDVYGEQGHPIRTTVSDMGPMLLSRLLGLNETQSGVMDILFRVADQKGLLILDLKDLRSMLNHLADNAAAYSKEWGNVSAASVGAIQRALLSLENQGADRFFAEPAFDTEDLFAKDPATGRGVMSVLAADKLFLNPKLYSTFLLWLLSDIYSRLPEVGDQELPKLVFFFDEAHTLFTDSAPALVTKIEQVVRLIRSKGVGVYFITQNPTDIPESILGQLGNRVQHALRAFTPKDQKAVRSAAETFRANPAFKTEDAIMELETGEALVSFLDAKGAPGIVQRAKILFPLSQIGPITAGQRLDAREASPIKGKYDTVVDRESAYEILIKQEQELAQQKQAEAAGKEAGKAKEKEAKTTKAGKSRKKTLIIAAIGAAIASFARSIGTLVSGMVTGKKSKKKTSAKDIAGKAVSSATSTAVRTITRDILGSLIK